MSITQQYLLDTYRARQHGDPTPPAPGAHDWQVMRELPDHRRFRAVLAGRPARGRVRARVRAAWTGLFARPGGKAGSAGRAAPTRAAGPAISGECAPRTP
ncbi:hypothetical protein ACFU96_46490 [Streptomyces sp. NPDC057620]|uniref:hypothetical protein n=1 Tax=Streptomyces sp. NPDC057620 TaxID=3346185 RepID=UPI0036BB3643